MREFLWEIHDHLSICVTICYLEYVISISQSYVFYFYFYAFL